MSNVVIDINTKELNVSGDTIVVQYEHDVTRLAFSIPRYDGDLDMSTASKIEIHYINSYNNRDVYVVDDLDVAGNNMNFSWLISANATEYSGRLAFLARFSWIDENNAVKHVWNSNVGTIEVSQGINNGKTVAAEFPDVLEAWKKELAAGIPQIVQSTGKSTEAVMSQKAVTDELNRKADWIDNTSSIRKVYTVTAATDYCANCPELVTLAHSAIENIIPLRNGRGCLTAPSSIDVFTDTDMVSKAYVDNAVASAGGGKLYRHCLHIGYDAEMDTVDVYATFYSSNAEKLTREEFESMDLAGLRVNGFMELCDYSTYTDEYYSTVYRIAFYKLNSASESLGLTLYGVGSTFSDEYGITRFSESRFYMADYEENPDPDSYIVFKITDTVTEV